MLFSLTSVFLTTDHFEIVVIVGACFLVNSVTQDGRTNWAEGLIMVGFYVIIVRATLLVIHCHSLTWL